jgi:lipoprotein Spr
MNWVARARAMVGTRFRPQGRSDAGLDCVGLMIAAYALPPESVPRDYRLAGAHGAAILDGARRHFRRIPRRQARPGDALLFLIDERQSHLAVKTERGFVHAHAGLGRVVETPGAAEWPLVAALRRRRKAKD